MTPKRLRAHVAELVEDFGAIVRLAPDECDCEPDNPDGHVYAYEPIDARPFNWPPTYLIFLTCEPGASTGAYLTALHELGHLHTGLAKRGWWRRMPKLQGESLAWRWALDQSLVAPTAANWWQILVSLCTYAVDGRNKRTSDFQALLHEAAKGAQDHDV